MRLPNSVFVALLLAVAIAVPVSAETLTLDDAFRIGLENNHGILIAHEDAERARGERGLGTAGFLPRLTANGNWMNVEGDDDGSVPAGFGETSTSSWGAGLSLDWTLFDGFKMFVDKGRYDELAQLGETRARATIEGELLQIAQAYFALVGRLLLQEVAEETLGISETRLEQDRVRRELGGLSAAAFLRAQVDYNADRAVLLNSELAVTAARQSLNLQLGRDPETPCETSREIPLEPLGDDREALLERADRLSSGLAVARLGTSVAEREAQSARSTFWPSLTLNAGYDLSGRELSGDAVIPSIETDGRDLSVGLRVSMDLFDGNRKRVRLSSANAASRIAELEQERAELTLRTDLLTLIETWEQRQELVLLEEENTEAARRSLELNEESYRSGASTSLEFRDSQVALARAQSALITARYLARLARLDIERLTGLLPVGSP